MLCKQRKLVYRLISAVALALATLLSTPLFAVDVPVECQLVYETADGFFVDVGINEGLEAGEKGWLRRDGEQIGQIEVIRVAQESALLRLVSGLSRDLGLAGERITILFDRPEPTPTRPPVGREPSPTLRDRAATEEPFVPLLAPPGMKDAGFSDAENIFHGTFTTRQIFQLSSDGDTDYSITRGRTSGSLERIGRSPWTLEWSGEASYRTGDLEYVRDFEQIRLEVYRLALFRRFDDESFVRIGRFIPRELPSVGFLDGIHGEKVLTKHIRVGSMLGFKPERDGLNVVFEEPTAVAYTTFEAGDRLKFHYTGTAGVLASLYEGDADRLAILIDQRMNFGKLSLYSTSDVDLDIGAAEVHDGPRVTRWDVSAAYSLTSWLGLRAGVDRFERPDTEAERDFINTGALDPEDFYDRGFWRYWTGANHALFWNLYLSEEVSLTDSEDENYTFRWNASLTRSGLPWLPAASLTVTAYNLNGGETEGYGGRISAYLPFSSYGLSLHPSVAARKLESDLIDDDEFEVADASLRVNWVLSPSWTVSAGGSYAFTDDVQRSLFDLAFTFRW